MILIGQYDSPFVRRCAIAMTLYGMPFEHRPWSTFAQGDLIAPYNPLRRVPTLVLDDGDVVIDSTFILDWIEEEKGDGTLIARSGPERRQAHYYTALALGCADKAVSLFYEKALHEKTSPLWVDRVEGQVRGVLDRLEEIRAAATSAWLLGDYLNHADIALGCALRFTFEAHPGVFDSTDWPALAAHSAACEALPVFDLISQPFAPPGGR